MDWLFKTLIALGVLALSGSVSVYLLSVLPNIEIQKLEGVNRGLEYQKELVKSRNDCIDSAYAKASEKDLSNFQAAQYQLEVVRIKVDACIRRYQ